MIPSLPLGPPQVVRLPPAVGIAVPLLDLVTPPVENYWIRLRLAVTGARQRKSPSPLIIFERPLLPE